MRILTGIQPSGLPHLGNYFGAMRQVCELQEKGESFLFIADMSLGTFTEIVICSSCSFTIFIKSV